MGDALIFKIFRIKVIFTLLGIILAGSVISGSLWMRDNPYLTTRYIEKTLAYFKYRIEFVQAQKNLTAGVFSSLGEPLSFTFEKSQAQAIPVLLYHGVLKEEDGSNITVETFQDQMFALKRAGYQTISFDDFYAFMKGRKTLPEKSFLLTFDDGRKDSYFMADPILKALDYQATMFVITRFSLIEDGDVFYLSRGELHQMLQTGRWDIQSHSRDSHVFYQVDDKGGKNLPLSNKLWINQLNRMETDQEYEARIARDLSGARDDIYKELGFIPQGFAYPYGDFAQGHSNFPQASDILLASVQKIYPLAFFQLWPSSGFTYNYPQRDTFMMKRFDVNERYRGKQLVALLDAGRPKTIPYYENFAFNNGWLKTWGDLEVAKNQLITGGGKTRQGSSVHLDGSLLWKDYLFESTVQWPKGSSISVVARYQDDRNFASCEFNRRSKLNISIEQTVAGKNVVLAEKNIDAIPAAESFTPAITVKGSHIECRLNGKIIATANTLSTSLSYGGIGLRTWDNTPGNSLFTVNQVSVIP